MPDEQTDHARHRYHLKGAAAEELVQGLAAESFFVDWCFPNPKLPNGKELCDLLVVFDDVAIIWQIKDVKLRADGHYNPKEVAKNVRQLLGAHRKLFKLKEPVTLQNSRRHEETFDPDLIREVHLVSVLAGDGEIDSKLAELKDGHLVHMFTRSFLEIALNELDTISDFVQYLRIKEAHLRSTEHILIEGGEEELLAFFLIHGRTLDELAGGQAVVFEFGSWVEFERSSQYRAKRDADRISYYWDEIIDRIHERGSREYELVARELARPNRFERRVLGKLFYNAHIVAHENSEATDYRDVVPWGDGRTFCFAFMDDPESRAERKGLLSCLCRVSRVLHPQNTTVIGVATNKTIGPTTSYDYELFHRPEISDGLRDQVDRIQRETGLLTNLDEEHIHEDEYPST